MLTDGIHGCLAELCMDVNLRNSKADSGSDILITDTGCTMKYQRNIYNFPDLTGYCFNADVVARIVKANPNVVGIKDTIADFNHVLSMQKVKEINPDFSVFSAYENQAMGLLVCGVDGFINATANFAPEYTVNTYQSAKRGDFNEAAKWFNKMVEAMDIYAYSTPLFLACKQAMYYRVLHHDGQERLPALSLDATAKANVYNKMRDLELL